MPMTWNQYRGYYARLRAIRAQRKALDEEEAALRVVEKLLLRREAMRQPRWWTALVAIALTMALASPAYACWPYGQVQQPPPLKCYTVNLGGTLHTYCR